MVKLWNGEDVQWRLTLQLDGKAGTLELGDEPRQMLVRLGEKEKLTAEELRRAAAKAAGQVKSLGGDAALLDAAPAVEALGGEGLAALIQGFELALYRQENWKQEKKEDKAPDLWLTGTEGVDAEKILAETGAMDRWVCFARDLANRPGNKLTPDMLAKAVTGADRKSVV